MANAPKKSLTLLDRILAKLNLTEEGKFNHFLDKLATQLRRDIKALTHNKESIKQSYEADLEIQTEKIEDAKDAVENSLIEVTVENISTNERQQSFMQSYWRNYEGKQDIVVSLKDTRNLLTVSYEKQVEGIDNQITELNRRLALITSA